MSKIHFYQIKNNTFSDDYVRTVYKQFASSIDLNQLLSTYRIQDESLLEEIMLCPELATPDLYVLLRHQKLSIHFIKEYILNPDWQTNDREKNITFAEIKYYQGYDESLFE